MVVFINAQGTAQFVVPTPIYQNSNAGGQITLVAPFPRTTSAEVYFTLPSGAVTQKYAMTSALSTGETNAAVPDGWSVWSLITPVGVITAQKGTASATFVLQYTAAGAIAGQTPTYETLTTSPVEFQVYGADTISLPNTVPESNQWEQVIAAFNSDSGRITALESLLPVLKSATYANGELTFTDTTGETVTVSLNEIIEAIEAADTKATNAITVAQAAETKANSAVSTAGQAEQTATQASDTAAAAYSNAIEAQATANGIAGTANEAKTLASAANTNAAQAVSDVAQLRQDLNDAQFFRGYFATTELLTATEATENDYAYNAQDGKVWVYHEPNGWEATTQDVPDQSVPKATTSPLMDGTAAIGSSDEYAAADHVHPTDTSRASKAEVGDLSDLSTTDKSSIVAAINEAAASGGITELTDSRINLYELDAGIYLNKGRGRVYYIPSSRIDVANVETEGTLIIVSETGAKTTPRPFLIMATQYTGYYHTNQLIYGFCNKTNSTETYYRSYDPANIFSGIMRGVAGAPLTREVTTESSLDPNRNHYAACLKIFYQPNNLNGRENYSSDTNTLTSVQAVKNALPALVAGDGIIIGSTTDSTSGKTTWTISADTSVNIDQALTDGKNLNGGSITFSSVAGTFGSTYYGYVGVDLGDYGAAIIGINYDGSGEITGGTVYDYSAYGGSTSQVGAIPQTIEVRDGSGDVGTDSYVKALYVMDSTNASMFSPLSFSGTFDSTWTSTTNVSSYGITLKVIV